MDVLYYHLNKLHLSYNDAIAELTALYNANYNGQISILNNIAGTECIVKVVGATPTWHNKKAWKGCVLNTYTKATHGNCPAKQSIVLWKQQVTEDELLGR